LQEIDEVINTKFKRIVEMNGENFKVDDIWIKHPKMPPPKGGSEYTEEEDRFLAYCLYKYGYTYWHLIRNEIRNSPRFMFNWAFKSKTNNDIQKRCDHLIGLFKKELNDAAKVLEEAKKKKGGAKGKQKAAAKKKAAAGKKQVARTTRKTKQGK